MGSWKQALSGMGGAVGGMAGGAVKPMGGAIGGGALAKPLAGAAQGSVAPAAPAAPGGVFGKIASLAQKAGGSALGGSVKPMVQPMGLSADVGEVARGGALKTFGKSLLKSRAMRGGRR